MKHLNKIVFLNSANIPYAEVMLDGNVHFAGTQGVGKSTVLRALLFFYNADKMRLGIQQGQKSFEEFYFRYSNSYIVYEVKTEHSAYSILTYRSQGKAVFRFIDAPYEKSWFVDNDGRVESDWIRIRERIGNREISAKIETYEQYRNIIFGNPHDRSHRYDKYAIVESAKYQNIPRSIQNVFLNSKLDADFVKNTIIQSMTEVEDSIRLSDYRHLVADFECEFEEIESNAVGFKDDYDMFSMDFKEFLWAKGYRPEQIEDMYRHMVALKPFSQLEMDAIMDVFRDYMSLGGMPEVVKMYIDNGHFGGTLELQRQLLKDYEEDITKYAKQTDKAKVLAVYNHISTFLAKDNKKYQITKIAKGARNREYVGAVDWLKEAGVINVCYCLNNVELPLKGNYMADYYKLYYHDTGLLIASLDEEAQEDLRANKNFGTYKGAIYENIVGEMLRKSGYDSLYFYKHENPALEMDFFVRDANSLVPVEVKAKDNATASLNNLIKWESYPDVKYGIKLGYKNIGWNG